MAARAHKVDIRFEPDAIFPADDREPAASPARALQGRLEAAFPGDSPEPHVRRWPAPVRIVLPLVLSGALWAAMVAGVRAILIR